MKTNAEYIRSLTDEDLASLLCSTGWHLWEQKQCLEWLKETADEPWEL